MDIMYSPKPDLVIRSCTKSVNIFKHNSSVTYVNFEDEYGMHNLNVLASFEHVQSLLKEPVVDLCSMSIKINQEEK